MGQLDEGATFVFPPATLFSRSLPLLTILPSKGRQRERVCGRKKQDKEQHRRHRRLRSPALADGRRAARQHGRRRVQARRPRPDLPQVHLRRLRGAARQARSARRHKAPIPKIRTNTARSNIFWVPPEARWSHLKAQAKQPTIGKLVDDAMAGIERDNPSLKGVLPKDYARPALDKQRLGQLIDLISNISSRRRREHARRTCSAASTNTSSPSSPAPRARKAASSTRRAASSAAGRDARALQRPRLRPLLRLRRHVRAVGEVRRSARTAARLKATSASTARSATTPPGGSPR